MSMLTKYLIFFTLVCVLFSCKKESVTTNIYTEPALADIQKKLIGVWKNRYIEQELYQGNVMTKKTVITSTLNTFNYKSDFTYTSVFETAAAQTGTWELLSNSYLHLDKDKATDRYYHIITLDEHNFVYRGPFDVAGNIKFGYLLTGYDFK